MNKELKVHIDGSDYLFSELDPVEQNLVKLLVSCNEELKLIEQEIIISEQARKLYLDALKKTITDGDF